MERSPIEKIDFLMTLTGVSNAQLARALNFDASYISRIRAGKRRLPPSKPFLAPACDFFVRRVTKDYQRRALADELKVALWPDDAAVAAELLANWLASDGAPADADDGSGAEDTAVRPDAAANATPLKGRIFLGEAGRRDAALAFLSALVQEGYAGELLLQSDEDMAWMYDDGFLSQWAGLLVRLAHGGCTMTVIHTMSRDADEMVEGVRSWLALYLTGAIRPFYYPRLRDGVRKRSLFVAPGRAALVSNSVRGMGDGQLSMLLEEPTAIAALRMEFDAYQALCKPLLAMIDTQEATEARGILAHADLVQAAGPAGTTVAFDGECAYVFGPQPENRVFKIDEPRLVASLTEYLRTTFAHPAS